MRLKINYGPTVARVSSNNLNDKCCIIFSREIMIAVLYNQHIFDRFILSSEVNENLNINSAAAEKNIY